VHQHVLHRLQRQPIVRLLGRTEALEQSGHSRLDHRILLHFCDQFPISLAFQEQRKVLVVGRVEFQFATAALVHCARRQVLHAGFDCRPHLDHFSVESIGMPGDFTNTGLKRRAALGLSGGQEYKNQWNRHSHS
jgi:hypothetical protein